MIPELKEIRQRFCKAKEVICLELGIKVHVQYLKKYEKRDGAWYGLKSPVCFWEDGEYAEITKERECNCKKQK